MAYTKFTGKDIAATFNAVAGTGLTEIEIAEDGESLPERVDTTIAGDSAYVFSDDPLGGKEAPKTRVRITVQTSKNDVADARWITLGGLTYSLVCQESADVGSSKFTLADAHLEEITTTVSIREFGQRSFTFGCDDEGAWSTVAA